MFPKILPKIHANYCTIHFSNKTGSNLGPSNCPLTNVHRHSFPRCCPLVDYYLWL